MKVNIVYQYSGTVSKLLTMPQNAAVVDGNYGN